MGERGLLEGLEGGNSKVPYDLALGEGEEKYDVLATKMGISGGG